MWMHEVRMSDDWVFISCTSRIRDNIHLCLYNTSVSIFVSKRSRVLAAHVDMQCV
jgi:hypothetical protein